MAPLDTMDHAMTTDMESVTTIISDEVPHKIPEDPKQVRFEQSVQVQLFDKISGVDDAETKWWSSEDLQSIRHQAKNESLALRPLTTDSELEMAHRKTTLMLNANFPALLKLTPSSPDQDLSEWCQCNDGRRGLERFASRVYSCFRRRDLKSVKSAVFEEQERQKSTETFDPRLIAEKSREASLRSRNFAHYLGEADAKVVSRNRRRGKRTKAHI